MTTRKLAAICAALVLQSLVLPSATAQAAPSRTEVEQRIERLGAQISRANEDFNLARLELSRIDAQIRDIEAQKEAAGVRLESLRRETSERAVAVYRAGPPQVLLILLGSESLTDFQRRLNVLSSVQSWEAGMMEELVITRARSERLAAALAQERARQRTAVQRISEKRKALDKIVLEQRRLLARLDAAAAAARFRPPPRTRQVFDFGSLPVSPQARIAVQVAYEQIGKPYRYGASGPDAFDCSGLTMYAWGKAGVSLPHATNAQWEATKRVSRANLQPGDLIFYSGQYRHVGIYIGNNKMIHAVHPGVNARIDDIDYMPGYRGAGRPGV